MELIKEIYEGDIGIKSEEGKILYDIRKAARAVVFNKEKQMPMLFVSKNNYHKLPGGGIEGQESNLEALEREIEEEVGAKVKIGGEIGLVIEYRNQHQLLQLSYCYFAEIVDELQKPDFTDEEISNGFQLEWYSIDKALETVRNDQPYDYVGKFIQQRDLTILTRAKELMDKELKL